MIAKIKSELVKTSFVYFDYTRGTVFVKFEIFSSIRLHFITFAKGVKSGWWSQTSI